MTMEKTKIHEAIYNVIESTIRETSRDVTLIVMHPQTWVDLINETSLDASLPSINTSDSNLKYLGIKVLRSIDLPLNYFECR